MLENLSPGQRQALMFGAPVVAVFALISVLQKRNQPAVAVTPTTGGTPATFAASTDAIGTGQLAEFESLLTGGINELARMVGRLPTDIPAATIVNPVAPTPTKTLAPVRSEWFPAVAGPDEGFSILGSISGGTYQGRNVTGGVPVYAKIGGVWQQNFGSNLPEGTPLGIPSQFNDYIAS